MLHTDGGMFFESSFSQLWRGRSRGVPSATIIYIGANESAATPGGDSRRDSPWGFAGDSTLCEITAMGDAPPPGPRRGPLTKGGRGVSPTRRWHPSLGSLRNSRRRPQIGGLLARKKLAIRPVRTFPGPRTHSPAGLRAGNHGRGFQFLVFVPKEFLRGAFPAFPGTLRDFELLPGARRKNVISSLCPMSYGSRTDL